MPMLLQPDGGLARASPAPVVARRVSAFSLGSVQKQAADGESVADTAEPQEEFFLPV